METYKVTVEDDGTIRYYKPETGKLHRVDGPAIECTNGTKFWYLDGNIHREDGPAVEWANGNKEWYLDGKSHRVDGPAIECADGHKSWWLNDKLLTEKQWKQQVSELTNSCEGKVVEIDGKKYKLTEV